MSQVDAIAAKGVAATGRDERARLRQAAEAFESLLVHTLLKEMRKAQLEDGFFGKGPGASTYQAIFDQHMSERLAEGSPLGVAKLLLDQWEERLDGTEDADGALRELDEARAAVAYGAALEDSAGVSSGFGWRKDPIDGTFRDAPRPRGAPGHGPGR